jgi:MFS family permease
MRTLKAPTTRAPVSGSGHSTSRLLSPLFVLVTLSTFAYFTSVGALQPTLPRFVEGPLGGGSVAVGLSVGIFSISAVLMRPFGGYLSDLHGRRMAMVVGAAAVSAAVLCQIWVPSLVWLVPLRVAAGLGEALFWVGAAAVVSDLAPEHRRGEAVSYFSLALYGGLVLGPVLGETILDQGSYGRVWVLAAGLAVLAALLGVPVGDTRLDLDSPTVSGWRRFLHPGAILPGTVLATSMLGLGGFFTFVPLYALELGMSGSKLVFALFSGIVLVVRSFGARLPDRLGSLKSARGALTGQAAGLTIAALWQTPAGLFAGTVVYALGQSLAFPALMTMAVGRAAASERGAVVGTFSAFFDFGFGLGAVALGAVAGILGYASSFLVGAAVALGGLMLLALRGRSI